MGRRRYAGAIIVGAVAMICLGIGAGYLLAPAPVPGSLASDTGASEVGVEPITFDDPRQVTLIPSASTATLLTVNRPGVVTAFSCAPGSAINSGDIAIAIDDQPIPYLALRIPLWRDLALGDTGDDVRSLQESLAAMGFGTRADGEYGQETARAVTAFKEQVGLDLKDPNLSRSDVVWIPSTTVTIATCTAQLGQELSAPGEISQTEVGLASVSIEGIDSAATPGSRALVFDSLTISLSDPLDEISDPELLSALRASAQYAAWKSSEGETKITATVSLAEPITAYVVPPSSLLGDGTHTCVVADGVAQQVRVLSSTLGRVVIQADATLSVVEAPAPAGEACP